MSRVSLPPMQPACAVEKPLRNATPQRFARLPRRAQQVFLLSRLDGLDFAQIGERLDLRIECVERLMAQALHATLPPPSAIAAQACRWYVRLQNPATTACERIDFRRWLDASPAHLHAFHATELHWRSLLAPAQALGERSSYRQGRAALSLGGCALAVGLGVTAVLAFGLGA